MTKYLAFDIEIAKPVPDGLGDLLAFRPLGISCAATLRSGGEPVLWHGEDSRGGIAERLSMSEAQVLVHYLAAAAEQGYTIVTWNGLGFDFDVLAEESGLLPECRSLAQSHVDMMFHFFCVKGFPLALDKAAKGLGLAGKPAGMSGALAPKMWVEGRRAEVLEYVARDVRTTLEVAEAVERRRSICWFTERGRFSEVPLPAWLKVEEALRLPLPDTSWMRNPMSRQRFARWL